MPIKKRRPSDPNKKKLQEITEKLISTTYKENYQEIIKNLVEDSSLKSVKGFDLDLITHGYLDAGILYANRIIPEKGTSIEIFSPGFSNKYTSKPPIICISDSITRGEDGTIDHNYANKSFIFDLYFNYKPELTVLFSEGKGAKIGMNSIIDALYDYNDLNKGFENNFGYTRKKYSDHPLDILKSKGLEVLDYNALSSELESYENFISNENNVFKKPFFNPPKSLEEAKYVLTPEANEYCEYMLEHKNPINQVHQALPEYAKAVFSFLLSNARADYDAINFASKDEALLKYVRETGNPNKGKTFLKQSFERKHKDSPNLD